MKLFNTHIGFMAFSTYFRIGSQLLVFLVLARLLGVEQFGQFSFWFSLTTLVTIPINYGFGIQLLREAARMPEALHSILAQMLSAKLFLTIIVVFCCVLFSFFVTDTELFWLLLLMAIVDSYIDFYNFALRSQGHYSYESKLTFIISLLQLPLITIAAFLSSKIVIVAAAYLLSRIVGLILTLRIVHQYLSLSTSRLVFSYATIMNTLRGGFPYAADMGVTTLNTSIDIILLKQMTDVRTVGIYQAGMRLLMGGTTPATVVSNVYLPRVSAIDCNSAAYSTAIINLNMRMVTVGGGISLLLAMFSKQITTTLFGPSYQDLARLLPWFSLVLVLRYIAASFGINLTASGHQSVRVIANLMYLIIIIGAALLLVPTYKVIGLLMASVCSVLVLTAIYYMYVIMKKLPSGFNSRNSILFITIISIIICIILGDLQ